MMGTMTDAERLCAGPTLTEALLERGFDSRAPRVARGLKIPLYAKEIYRLADGVVIGFMTAHDAWQWIDAGCRVPASPGQPAPCAGRVS